MNKESACVNRRSFLNGMGLVSAAVAMPAIIPCGCVSNRIAPSHKITLGFIGMGNQGKSRNLGTFLNQDDARVLAVCDCKLSAAHAGKAIVDKRYGNSDCVVYQDFRDVLARPDIDAVVISTPDHWHIPMSMMALEAGKDVFCEKPSLFIKEGLGLVEAVKRHNAAFQWGIEDRSLIKYHHIAGLVRSGAIGELKSIHVTLPGWEPFPVDEEVPVPDDLDWNLWLGPAPMRPYTSTITGPMNWRFVSDFGGGMITDWGAHLIDTAQVAAGVNETGPVEVSGTGRELDPRIHQTNTPVGLKLHYKYANGVEMFVDDGEVNLKFVGTKGWVQCFKWDGILSASDPSILHIKDYGRKIWPLPPIEHRDFLNAMRTGSKPAYFAEAGHRLSTTLHLGHIAIRRGTTVKWNPKKQFFMEESKGCAQDIVYDRPARDWRKG